MKVNAVFLTDNKSECNFKRDKYYLAAASVTLILSVFITVIIYCAYKDSFDLLIKDEFTNYFYDIKIKSKSVKLADLLLPYLLFYFVIILSSTSVIGNIAITVFSFMKFSGITLLITCLYSNFSLQGIEYCFLILLPGKLLYIFSILILMKTGYFAVNLIKERSNDKRYKYKKIFVLNFISLIVMFVSILIDYFCLSTFNNWFNF